jgi:CheY-like chemotaxis protein
MNNFAKSVLIVDRFSTMRRILSHLLGEIGFDRARIWQADNTDEALALLSKQTVDLIISGDIFYEIGISGLLRRVRMIHPRFNETHFIFLLPQTQITVQQANACLSLPDQKQFKLYQQGQDILLDIIKNDSLSCYIRGECSAPQLNNVIKALFAKPDNKD